MKSIPWVLAGALLVLVVQGECAARGDATIAAREDTLATGRERVRRATLAKLQARAPVQELRRRYRGFNVDSLLALPGTMVSIPRPLLLTANQLITADSVALAADDTLEAAQADHIAVAERQVTDLTKRVRAPWLTASAAVFVRADPGLRGELELGVRGLIVRGVLEADTAGMQRRLEVGMRKSVRLF